MRRFPPQSFFNLSGFGHRSIFEGCNQVWEVLRHIESYLLKRPLGIIESEIPDGAFLANEELISIGKGTVIEPGAYIIGPCIIGDNCSIRHGAYIRGNFICGDGCVIGHATEIKNSLFLNDAQAAHFSYIGDTILGNKTNLGAGTKCANLRFDNRPVRINLGDTHVDTGLRKFGAVFGDFSQSGCNSVTNPGTLLEKGSSIYPCAAAHGIVPEGHALKSDGSLVLLNHSLS